MVCKACGAVNPEGTKYCKICASAFDSDTPDVYQSPSYVEPPVTEESPQPESGKDGWGFVRAPRWPKPEFKADSITEEDLSAFERAEEPDAPAAERQDYTGYAPRHFTPSPQKEEAASPSGRTPARFSASAGRSAPYRASIGEDDDFDAPVSRPRSTVYSMNDEDSNDSEAAPRFSTAPVPYRTRQQGTKAPDYGFADHRGKKSHPHRRSGSNAKNILFWAAAGLLAVVVIVLLLSLFTKDSGGIGAFVSGIFSSGPVTRDASVEKSKTKDGQPAYIITIYAKKGTTVRFTAGTTQKDFPVTSGKIDVRIAEAMWIPQEPVDASPLMVTPDFKVIAEDGSITPVEMDPIAIAVPALTLTITSPQSASVTTNNGKVQIAGTLSDPGAMAYINDQECTVDAAGNFTGTYTAAQTGSQTVTVEARKAGFVTAKTTLTVESSAAAASTIALAKDGTLRGSAATFTVNGTMEPGSTVTVTGDVTGEPTVDSAAGTFSFTANTPEVGQYSAVVTATKNGVSSTKEFHLEHAPDRDAYAVGAHVMDYERILAAPTHNQAYKCVGTIKELIEEGETILAKMDVGDGKVIVLEYHPNYPSAAKITVGDGKTYSIFAYPNGMYETSGLPLMYAWFVLKG